MTNAVTPRCWIYLVNRPLSDICSEYLCFQTWLIDMDLHERLIEMMDDLTLLPVRRAATQLAQVKCSAWMKQIMGTGGRDELAGSDNRASGGAGTDW